MTARGDVKEKRWEGREGGRAHTTHGRTSWWPPWCACCSGCRRRGIARNAAPLKRPSNCRWADRVFSSGLKRSVCLVRQRPAEPAKAHLSHLTKELQAAPPTLRSSSALRRLDGVHDSDGVDGGRRWRRRHLHIRPSPMPLMLEFLRRIPLRHSPSLLHIQPQLIPLSWPLPQLMPLTRPMPLSRTLPLPLSVHPVHLRPLKATTCSSNDLDAFFQIVWLSCVPFFSFLEFRFQVPVVLCYLV